VPPPRLTFLPRLLYLCRDPARVRAQLAGSALSAADVLGDALSAAALRDDISTDEISPLPAMVHFDSTLGRYPYTGFKAGDELPIGRDDVMRCGFEVVVAGRRYGKGSSREHSVVAELSAGIRLVIAESFERIYRQNADNLGLFTSTDLGLVPRIERGEPIALEELLAGRDALAAAILRTGGLLEYGRIRFGTAGAPRRADGVSGDAAAPATLFHKIVARHLIGSAALAAGEGGFVHADYRFIHEYYTGMCAHLLAQSRGPSLRLFDPASIVAFEDHLSYVHRSPVHVANGLVDSVRSLSQAHRDFVAAHGLTHHGYLQPGLAAGDPGNTGSEGISHAVMAERYALPGQLVAGTDSHTPHSGALGCVAFGVGTTDMANAFVTGAVRIAMPEVLKVEFHGILPEGITAKDLALHLLADPAIRAGAGVGKVFEFAGEVVRRLGTDERATLTNMTAELGGFTGIVEPDAESVRFLKERRGIDFVLESWMSSDPGAPYAGRIRIDCSTLSPMVARPGDPGNGLALAQLSEPVRIDIAYGGSCTAGKREDFDHYHAVLSWAASHGLRVAPHVELYLQFGTDAVRQYCVERGYLSAFEAVGAHVLHAACGACANCGPGASSDPSQVTVSAINRNFAGRSGPGQVWLASPPTVAASAIAGELVSFEGLRGRVAPTGARASRRVVGPRDGLVGPRDGWSGRAKRGRRR
jgi:3-isopropylmalate/(R)-2-methylmalate dehydratase large subunit